MAESTHYSFKYQQLLRDLKTTVEGLLVTQAANVWSIYGGLNRLHSCLEKIFRHGLKSVAQDGFYNFIQGLEWLQPETSKSCVSVDCEFKSHIPVHLKDDKSSIWLYKSLENHSLSQKLSWLLSDKTHILSCYQSFAYLCQESYVEATLICLRAVERNQASLMSEINPCLFLSRPSAKEFHKIHRRCFSFPENHLKIYEEKKIIQAEKGVVRHRITGKMKPWSSMPSLCTENFKLTSRINLKFISKTTPSTPIYTKKVSPSLLTVDYKSVKTTLKSKPKKNVKHVIIDNKDIVEHTPPLSSSHSSGNTLMDKVSNNSLKSVKGPAKSPKNMAHSPLSLVDSFLVMPGEKDYLKLPKKSFIEGGGMCALPVATRYFPKPAKGQSLTSFLTSSQFSRANAELDRENAHFSISEAIISAMEQIKCKRDLKLADEQLDESDPEIMDLKQRIRLRRRQTLVERQRRQWAANILSDGKTDTTTTVSPRSTPTDSPVDYSSSDDIEDLEINQSSTICEDQGMSASLASLYSEDDLAKRPRGAPDGASDVLSAEGVALSLISKFSERQLPRASDLDWLVSEEDAPQALLPLPKSWPVSPDETNTPLRGTQEWAPPRPQIIFTMHPAPSRKILMEKQNYRCAGCSMRVAPKYASKYRYCDYLGKYFCTGCHKNQVALIPGRVLQKWDFSRYPVSTFSYRLLEQMFTDPLFRVFELNKNISNLSKNLILCDKYRLGLFYLKEYIFTCRYAETAQEKLQQEVPSYVLTDPEVYSMDDLVNIRTGDMKKKLMFLFDICCKHTSECKLCLARGFICELCKDSKVIFPWQLRFVRRCDKCGTCYHSKCWDKALRPCSKCLRVTKRKESISAD